MVHVAQSSFETAPRALLYGFTDRAGESQDARASGVVLNFNETKRKSRALNQGPCGCGVVARCACGPCCRQCLSGHRRLLSKLQLIRYVIIPESAPHLLSQILYMFDYNVRQTSILGIVGAGGIGFYIINYIKFFEYGKAAVFMLVVLITVLIIDWVSVKIRDKYIMKAQHGQQVKVKTN